MAARHQQSQQSSTGLTSLALKRRDRGKIFTIKAKDQIFQVKVKCGLEILK
ncbi:hypothetical protein Syun_011221 [Stephania yunnanensis]|uniref:Uncharacterized protein n=1 Tax=Stephania yunnanensis TaxID=152371 RepID=A0AAP0PIA5_9MAGN